MQPSITLNDFQTVMKTVSKDHIAGCDKRIRADDMLPVDARRVWKWVLRGESPESVAQRLHISEVHAKGIFRDLCIRTGLLFQKQAEDWYLKATDRGNLSNTQIPNYMKQRERSSRFASTGK